MRRIVLEAPELEAERVTFRWHTDPLASHIAPAGRRSHAQRGIWASRSGALRAQIQNANASSSRPTSA